MLTITGADELRRQVGEELGVSSWHRISQERIDAFAAATDDFEELHTSPERAARTPWGVTIAHGLFTLSLGPKFLYEIVDIRGFSLWLNYGFDRVRWISPVPVDSRLRMRVTLTSLDEVDGGVRARLRQTFEIEGQAKPACVAQSVVAYFD